MDFKGINLGRAQFVTQFTLLSRDSRALNRKQHLNWRGNCFVNVVPFLWTQGSFVHNFTQKKYNTEEEKKKISHFFTFLPFTLKLAYFAPLNGEGQIFPVNYPKFLDNSNMINCWLTSWVPLWWLIKNKKMYITFSLFFARHFEFSLLCTRNGAGRIFQ